MKKNRSNPVKFNEKIKALIVAAYRTGMSIEDIQKKYDISLRRLYDFLSRTEKRKDFNRPSLEIEQAIVEAYQKGTTLEKIVEKLNLRSTHDVYDVVDKYGLHREATNKKPLGGEIITFTISRSLQNKIQEIADQKGVTFGAAMTVLVLIGLDAEGHVIRQNPRIRNRTSVKMPQFVLDAVYPIVGPSRSLSGKLMYLADKGILYLTPESWHKASSMLF